MAANKQKRPFIVTLERGLSYRYKGYIFTKNRPITVTSPPDVEYLSTVSALSVKEVEGASANSSPSLAPKKAAPAPPASKNKEAITSKNLNKAGKAK